MNCFSSSKYISAVAETRNISIAAERLGISQPALSAQLRKLEEQLGTILFDRSKHPLELTGAGELYLMYARRQQILDREFKQCIADLEDMKCGHLAIGGAAAFNISYLPETVARFSAKYPGIEMEIVEGNIPDITARALEGQVDVFITPSWNCDDRMNYEKLFSEKILLCVPPRWGINDMLKEWRLPQESVVVKRSTREKSAQSKEGRGVPQVSFAEFEELPFIILKEEQHIGHIMSKLFQKYDFKPKKCITVEQTMTGYGLTMAGVGVSLMTESTLRNSNFREYPALYMVDSQLCRRDMYAAYPKNKYLSKAAKVFIEILKSSLENH